MRGSIFFHCSSVRYTTRLLTGLTSGELNIPKISEKQTVKSLAISRGYCPLKVLQPLLRVVWCTLIGILTALAVFATAMTEEFGFKVLFVIVVGSFGVGAAALLVIDIVLFNEVRLYSDRIVKIWKFLDPVEVRFVNARLDGIRVPVGSRRRIFDINTSRLMALIKGVCYDESLVDTEDVGKMNSLLADLSGRRVKEFEAAIIRINNLVKEEKKIGA